MPTTVSPSSVGRRTAVLAGTVRPQHWDGRAFFEYSTDPAFGAFTATAALPFVAGGVDVPLAVQVDGLEPTTTYHARLVAENEHGLRRAASVRFTTATSAAPTVSTGLPASRGQSGVTLTGLVNANNAVTSYSFEYGVSPSLGSATPAATVGGDTTTPVSAALTGLTPGTLYYYRLSGSNGLGSAQSAIATFTTLPNAPPFVVTGAASGIGPGGATVAATVHSGGNATTYWFELGDLAFTRSLDARGRPSGRRYAATRLGGARRSRARDDLPLPRRGEQRRRRPGRRSRGHVHDRCGAASAAPCSTAPAAPPPPLPVLAPPLPPITPTPGPTTRLPTSGTTWTGSSGPNVYRGGAGPDRIDGRAGADRLFGGAGNDTITGGSGRDVVDAGAGNDRILARDRTRDVIRCGAGRDTVVADRGDSVARDCETVSRR